MNFIVGYIAISFAFKFCHEIKCKITCSLLAWRHSRQIGFLSNLNKSFSLALEF